MKECSNNNLPKWRKFCPSINDPFAETKIAEEIVKSVLMVDNMGYIWYIPREELRKLPKEE